MKARSMLLGLSMGSPNTRDQMPFERQPSARETPNTTVKKSYYFMPEWMYVYRSAGGGLR